MMKMEVSFKIEGRAFDQAVKPVGDELARIFRRLADQVEGMDIAELPQSRWAIYAEDGPNLGEARIIE
ncbi:MULTISPECIES: hypothetical protein [Luteibacter]|uniref:hypothetical protein n=1 Tax=Luteibacter TaxID=242605 RepID=UPI0005626A6F|nr:MULTISPECIES: hypothetical protein [unclassified Luteibacter]